MKIKQLSITNFKSVNHAVITDLKKINLLIGRPNVGKSNIIEALSIFCLPFLLNASVRKITNLVRFENENELFFDGNSELSAFIKVNNITGQLRYDRVGGLVVILDNINYDINKKYEVKRSRSKNKSFPYKLPVEDTPDGSLKIKRYIFGHNIGFRKGFSNYLAPPFGNNLLAVVEMLPDLKKGITSLFEEYGLKIVFDKASYSLKIMKEKNGDVFILPYYLIADTLQRVIFFKTAIASNENSVLLFEEPEAHAFPPYIVHITQEIITSKTNQFFITTHSPFVVNDFLENAIEDMAIYFVDYRDHQTVVKRLSDEDLLKVYKYGIDLFTNIEAYL